MVSPNPHRFLTSLCPPCPPSLLDTDLHESDIFYSSAPRCSFRNPPGILAALPDRHLSRPILFPKPLPTLPREYSRSAPVRVPVPKPRAEGNVEADADSDYVEEMMPPHEMVERGLSGVRRSGMTFSVVEGVGRTLKGRDLRQVRNAVWRQTGFLD